ncbi:MAG: STAS domain-containing protein [Coriobacteriia bacterium]|nr:STAS domain-containing protein [Coriobacteriia bacterium]
MELDITVTRDGGTCVMTLEGEVDVYTAPRLKESLIESMESGCANVLVDLEGVGFIDSSGLGVLVGGLRRAKENSGTIRLVCTRDNILKIFRITGLDKAFPIFSKVAEAREF